MNVSTIVIGYNSWHYLQKNLASLDFFKNYDKAEVLYVDNASTDDTRTGIAYSFPSVKTFYCGLNRGISAARNIGLVNSISDYLLFLDSDTIVNEEAIRTMIEYMEEHDDVGICSCKLIGGDGKPQICCKHFPTRLGVIKSGLHNLLKRFGYQVFNESFEKTFYPFVDDIPMEVDYIVGACMLIRRKAQIKVGFFDEKIFYGPEDADYCRRMKKVGYKVVCLPSVSIIHDYQRSVTKKFFSRLTLKQLQAYKYYFNKITKEKIHDHKKIFTH